MLQELHCGTQEDHRQGDYNAAPALESRQGKEGEADIGAVMDQLIVVEKRHHFLQRRHLGAGDERTPNHTGKPRGPEDSQ